MHSRKNSQTGQQSSADSGESRSRTGMSHEAAKLALVFYVNILNYFAEKYVPEEIQDSFQNLIKQYESYNSAKTVYIDWDKINAPRKCINRLEKCIQEKIYSIDIVVPKDTKTHPNICVPLAGIKGSFL